VLNHTVIGKDVVQAENEVVQEVRVVQEVVQEGTLQGAVQEVVQQKEEEKEEKEEKEEEKEEGTKCTIILLQSKISKIRWSDRLHT
jgi:hypothetical protein